MQATTWVKHRSFHTLNSTTVLSITLISWKNISLGKVRIVSIVQYFTCSLVISFYITPLKVDFVCLEWSKKQNSFILYRTGTVLILPVSFYFKYSSEALHTHQSISKFLLYCSLIIYISIDEKLAMIAYSLYLLIGFWATNDFNSKTFSCFKNVAQSTAKARALLPQY
jgi:hypothetical protein